MCYPSEKRYLKDAKRYNCIPVFKEIYTDFETPISIFKRVKAKFLLESVERGENVGRFSIVGLGMRSLISVKDREVVIEEFSGGSRTGRRTCQSDNPLNTIREYFSEFKVPPYQGLPPFFGGAIGFLGYEAVSYFEKIPVAQNRGIIPDGMLVIPDVVLVYDLVKRSVIVVVSTFPDSRPGDSYRGAVEMIKEVERKFSAPFSYTNKRFERKLNVEIESNMDQEQFMKNVEKCKEYIRDGEIIQVVISRKFTVKTEASPFQLYRALRIINPSPYMYLLDFGNFKIIGSSPEVMVRIHDGEMLLKPIAGTRGRGSSVAEDSALARELMADEKERAEHLMLVDLGRNDLGRVAMPGTVEVEDYMSIEKYSHVMHIVSTIKAELDPQYDAFDVIRATFPAGTLTGAPKVRAMEIIAEMEPERRGPYGGMIFYLNFNGNLDSCITIRTIVFENGKATVQTGAGIVAGSVPRREYRETIKKADALLSTLKDAAKGE